MSSPTFIIDTKPTKIHTVIKVLAFVPALCAGEIKDFMDCMHEWNQAMYSWRCKLKEH